MFEKIVFSKKKLYVIRKVCSFSKNKQTFFQALEIICQQYDSSIK